MLKVQLGGWSDSYLEFSVGRKEGGNFLEWHNVLPGGMQQVWENVMGRVREACAWSLRDFEQGSGVLVQELAGGGAAS